MASFLVAFLHISARIVFIDVDVCFRVTTISGHAILVDGVQLRFIIFELERRSGRCSMDVKIVLATKA